MADGPKHVPTRVAQCQCEFQTVMSPKYAWGHSVYVKLKIHLQVKDVTLASVHSVTSKQQAFLWEFFPLCYFNSLLIQTPHDPYRNTSVGARKRSGDPTVLAPPLQTM